MSRFRMTREEYILHRIPSDAVKVMAKDSDAVAYLYLNGNQQPCAAVFVGKRAKPEGRYCFKSDTQRENWVRNQFNARKLACDYKAEREQEKREVGRGVEVGHVLCASWGYDQTNVNFFQVVELVGKTMAVIREIAQNEVSDGAQSMTGKTMPDIGNFIGQPKRVKISEGRCKIDCMHLHVWDGRPKFTSHYA